MCGTHYPTLVIGASARASHASHCILSTWQLTCTARSGLSTGYITGPHAACSVEAGHPLGAQHTPVTYYALSTWQAHAKGTLSCFQQRPMLAVPYPDTPPHTTQSGTGCTDKLFTSYYNLGSSLPWEGGGPRGPACTPTSLGVDPSPSSAGSRGLSARPMGTEVEVGEQGGPVEPQWDRKKRGAQGYRDKNGNPGHLGPWGPCRPQPVLWARPQSRRQALPTLSAAVLRSWL